MARKPRVLLIQSDYNPWHVRVLANYEPLCLELIAAAIDDLADVQILDRRYESDKTLRKMVRDFEPDYIGITMHAPSELSRAYYLSGVCKSERPVAKLIVGRVHAGLMPDHFKDSKFDAICTGHGEDVFRDILLNNGRFDDIRGLTYKDGDKWKSIPMRDIWGKWYMPRRDLTKKYHKHYRVNLVVTSRGCPYRCKYCALWKAAGGKYRERPINNILEDISRIDNKKPVYLADDNTFDNVKRAHELADALKTAGMEGRGYFTYGRTDTIVKHPDLFEKWRKIGLSEIVAGLETFTDKGLMDYHKRNTIENNASAVKILQELGIINWAHFVIHHDASLDDFEALYEYIDKLKLLTPFCLPLTPLPGTDLWTEMETSGQVEVHNMDFFNFEYPVSKTKLPRRVYSEQVVRLWNRVYNLGYMKRRLKQGWPLKKRFGKLWQLGFYFYMKPRLNRIANNYDKLNTMVENNDYRIQTTIEG